MALIPITFQADLGDENAKGNMRPEDMAALFAFLYPQEAGILNITGQDCSQFGAINIVGSTAQVTFHKGYIVVQGRAIYVEEGTQVAFNLPTSGQVSGVLGIKINLAESGANEVSWFQKTTSAQTNDLLANTASGVYEFVLYDYTATNISLVLGAKTTRIINNLDNYIKNGDYITQPKDNNSKKIATTEFVKNSVGFERLNLIIGEMEIYEDNPNHDQAILYNTRLNGAGITFVDNSGNKYFYGNFYGEPNLEGAVYPYTNYKDMINVVKVSIAEFSCEGYSDTQIIQGGILSHKEIGNDNNKNGAYVAGGVQAENGFILKTIFYHSIDFDGDWDLNPNENRTKHMNITGILLKLKQ